MATQRQSATAPNGASSRTRKTPTGASKTKKEIAAADAPVSKTRKRKAPEEAVEAPAKLKKSKPSPAATPAANGTETTTSRVTKSTATTKKEAASAKKTEKAAAKPAQRKTAAKKEVEEEAPKPKAAPKPKSAPKPKAAPKPKKVAPPKPQRPLIGEIINSAPTQKLDLFVFGDGSSGELGLGSVKYDGKRPINVKRPRVNPNLLATTAGIVDFSCGGMHSVALTHDNKILTWGVNDEGALGRDTNWSARVLGADEDSGDEDDDDTGLNPRESNPAEVDTSNFVPKLAFVQVLATDSATFALTADGRVYGWGTFRASDGILGFNEKVKIQRLPVLIPGVKDVVKLAGGSHHVLALDSKGGVWAWGNGQQSQLGRRIIERYRLQALSPQKVGIRRVKFTKIACGSYHSFAIDSTGRVWAWGLNNFAETGIRTGAGEDDAVVNPPEVVSSLLEKSIVDIDGGEHHSIACSADGSLYTWGRTDCHQVGLDQEDFNEDNAIFDKHGKARILHEPTIIKDVPNVVKVAAGTDNSFALTDDGKAYAWGFSVNHQTGLGTDEDVELPTLIENTAVKERHLVAIGAGGQFSVVAALPVDATESRENGAAPA